MTYNWIPMSHKCRGDKAKQESSVSEAARVQLCLLAQIDFHDHLRRETIDGGRSTILFITFMKQIYCIGLIIKSVKFSVIWYSNIFTKREFYSKNLILQSKNRLIFCNNWLSSYLICLIVRSKIYKKWKIFIQWVLISGIYLNLTFFI